MLTVAGMLAINQGNARFARGCYVEALKRRPLQLKLPFRLAWTLVRRRSPVRSQRCCRQGLRALCAVLQRFDLSVIRRR